MGAGASSSKCLSVRPNERPETSKGDFTSTKLVP